MKRLLRLALVCAGLSLGGAGAPLAAQEDAAQMARDAARSLDEAGRALLSAHSARDRVGALAATVRAYESGLESMREGMRRAALRERRLALELRAREEEIARLLGVLQSMNTAPAPVLLLHPDGPTGTARAGMILADVTPALNTRAQELRRKLEEVAVLRSLQESAAETLKDGLHGAQQARTALSQAVSDRTDLPRRFSEDPVRTAILIASTETLEGFASGLSQITDGSESAAADLPEIDERIGDLPWPAQGQVLRRAGEADAAGVVRPGVVYATRPQALVTAPVAGTVRYAGPLLDYGNVMILEPRAETLFVFAGLETVYGEIGQVLPAGSPLGLMGPNQGDGIGGFVTQEGEGAGIPRTETLYIEIREGETPVDPESWFRTTKDGDR